MNRARRSDRRRRRLVASVLVVATGFAACGDDDSPLGGGTDDTGTTLSDDAVIEYHYGDSSVPPEYHRSYTLTVQPDEVHVVVDTYGDVLHDTTEPLPADVWRGLAEGVGDVEQLDFDDADDGCDGGTSRTLTVTDRDGTVVEAEFGVCGGANTDAADRLDAYVQPVIDSIPGWQGMLD